MIDVYPQWSNKWLTFKASDGNRYFYAWSTPDIDERAKVFLTMLLTAQASGKKVSIYRDLDNPVNGWYKFSFMNIHN